MNTMLIKSILAAFAADNANPTDEEIIDVAKSIAIRIDSDYGITVTRCGEESLLYAVSRLKKYDYNNGTISFTDENGQWCLPSIEIAGNDICNSLEQLGYKRGLYVPFSNGDEPKEYLEHWKLLRDIQRQQRNEYTQNKFREYCEEHNIRAIPEDILRNFTFELLPNEVKTVRDGETFTPAKAQCVTDTFNIDFLGTYCMNNGIIILIDHKGRTAVAPCSEAYINPDFLKKYGFREAVIYVPFSNGDLPADQYVADHWNSLCKRARTTV